jgi:hypothetical protein
LHYDITAEDPSAGDLTAGPVPDHRGLHRQHLPVADG